VLESPPVAKQQNVTEASIDLAVPNWTVIKNGLTILGVSATERM
jgi:arginyl-tRNA synthetase